MMKWREQLEYIKHDMKRSFAVLHGLEQTYTLRLWAIFIINTLGIIGFAVFKESFPLPVFLVILAVSALILFDMLWNICRKNVKDNFPELFEAEAQKYGEPENCLKCRLIVVGGLRFRGFSCRIYVYKKELIVRYRKDCLVINDGKHINIVPGLLGSYCEFKRGEKYVRCLLRKKQAQLIETWAENNKSKS